MHHDNLWNKHRVSKHGTPPVKNRLSHIARYLQTDFLHRNNFNNSNYIATVH